MSRFICCRTTSQSTAPSDLFEEVELSPFGSPHSDEIKDYEEDTLQSFGANVQLVDLESLTMFRTPPAAVSNRSTRRNPGANLVQLDK